MGVKFNKLVFLKLLSHVLNTDMIFVFKEMGTLWYQQHYSDCCCESL